MLTVSEFFAESHRGNAFGVKGALYGKAGHRGDDTNGWRAGTGIPSIVEGTVVRSEYQVGLGWVVTIWCPRLSVYVSNCHMQSKGIPVGKVIRYIGEYVGPIGNTGTLSLGVHDHVVVSYTSSNPASGSVVNPRPFINAAKLAVAGGSGSPLVDPTARPAVTTPEGTFMTQAIYTKFTQGLADADPRVAKIKSYFGGAGVTKFSAGVGVYARLDGTVQGPIRVQVSQADSRGNEWAADCNGEWRDANGTLKLEKACRFYELDEFLALCDAYLVGASSGQGGSGDTAVLAQIRDALLALPAEIDRYSDGKKQSA